MSDIANNFRNIRTMEEVSQALGIVLTNLNSINKNYYNIFLDSDPKYVELEMYDETGKLVTRQVPNLAMAKTSVYSGTGSPNGKQEAARGALYIDIASNNLYYKTSDTGTQGWWQLWADQNLNYLSPTGNGAGLTNLDATKITSGLLSPNWGGTGASALEGLIKGNGSNACTAAVDGEDFLGTSVTGMICWFPTLVRYDDSTNAIPHGWLICDGSAVSRGTYGNLWKVIGDKYGVGDGSTTFNIPDLRDRFVKGYNSGTVGATEEGKVGNHTHTVSGNTNDESSHTHGKGTFKITGTFCGHKGYLSGAFWKTEGSYWHGKRNDDGTKAKVFFDTDKNDSWTGSSGAGSAHSHSISLTTSNNTGGAEKNTVDNMVLIPIIKW